MRHGSKVNAGQGISEGSGRHGEGLYEVVPAHWRGSAQRIFSRDAGGRCRMRPGGIGPHAPGHLSRMVCLVRHATYSSRCTRLSAETRASRVQMSHRVPPDSRGSRDLQCRRKAQRLFSRSTAHFLRRSESSRRRRDAARLIFRAQLSSGRSCTQEIPAGFPRGMQGIGNRYGRAQCNTRHIAAGTPFRH